MGYTIFPKNSISQNPSGIQNQKSFPMFGIKFIKFEAMTYVLHYSNGKIKKEGPGLSFFYYAPSSSIVGVPLGSNDLPFIFKETTTDFQSLTIQGQITYKVTEPKKLAEVLDFTVDKKGHYLKNDHEKLGQRLINEAQAAASTYVQSLTLKEALRNAKNIANEISSGLQLSSAVQMLGVEILSVTVIGVKSTPEMARALEAETREGLQQEADEAIYARRNFAVEQERKIKESELNTEIAVEQKKKQIAEKKMEIEVLAAENERKLREMNMSADIAIEEQKKALIDMQSENERKEADTKGYALAAVLKSYETLDWKTLMAIGGQGSDAKLNIALAFRELAENAEKIGTLNITPDLLENMMQQKQTPRRK